ncbi:MAG TPA: DUF1622 domain-containing protein [Flavisolibacter sp.]|nr:DUF1622 domain-containing protein [Flavisolibacter sp.]
MKETENALKPIAEFVTKHLSASVEILAALVITIALVKFLIRYMGNLRHPHFEQENQNIRIQFGSSLTIALELLLAADILATAIAPTWDDIGKLAAIATLRTALNYFLERELKETTNRKEPLATTKKPNDKDE